LFTGKAAIVTGCNNKNETLWEEIIAYFPLIRQGQHGKRKFGGGGHSVKYEMGSGAMMYIPTFIKIGSSIQN
jgi:hypothetical protein